MYQCSKCGKSVEDGKACSCMFENINQPGVGAPDMTAQTPVQEQPPVEPVAQQPIEMQPIVEPVAQPTTEPAPQPQPVVEQAPVQNPEPVISEPKVDPNAPIQEDTPVFEQPQQNNINAYSNSLNNNAQGVIASMKNFFLHPASAVKEAVKNNSFKVGLICMLIYILVLGIIGLVNSVESSLSWQNKMIKEYQEDLEDAKDDLKENEDSEYMKEYYEENVESAKKRLDKAKKERNELFTDGDFYKGLIKSAWNRMFDPLVTLALLVVILFVMGKVFNGNGSFTGLIAGVGLATSIYLISVLVLPLLAKIPHMDFLTYLIPAFNYIFALLVYVAFTASFDFDTDKSVWAVLVAFAIAMLISGLIGEQMLKSALDSSASDLESSLKALESLF